MLYIDYNIGSFLYTLTQRMVKNTEVHDCGVDYPESAGGMWCPTSWVGSFIGPMAASFQVNPPEAPSKGDIETAELYGKRVAETALRLRKEWKSRACLWQLAVNADLRNNIIVVY